jgi:hypothetical protein
LLARGLLAYRRDLGIGRPGRRREVASGTQSGV